MTPTNDQILVLRFQAGDETAFERLFELHGGPLKYYLRRLLESEDRADDAAQTTWLLVLRNIRKLRQLGAFRSWLFSIARNEALKRLKAAKRDLLLLARDLDAGEVSSDEPEFGAEDAHLLHKAMDRIHPIHREVLVLRYIEEMSYEQIAVVVACNIGTVRSRMHNAKRAVRKLLKGD
jgi:RNA polymerase sigma-70 factor (ECF subfamily)